MQRLISALVIAGSFALAPVLKAEGASVHTGLKVLGGMSTFYFSDESKQGGKALPGGSTMLTSLSLQYNDATYFGGAGLFFHLDQVGESEENSVIGIKFDFYAPGLPYYAEFGYGFSATQNFTNRAAETRQGTLTYFGLGLRLSLMPWLYFDGSIKQRQWHLTKEDGISLAAAITKTQLIPSLGLGVAVNL